MGQGTIEDLKVARSYYKKAAHLGYVRAQFWLGYFYETHLEIKNAAYRCSYWYRKASKQNDVQAIVALGYCYESGFGVKRDLKRAVELYLRAAKLNALTKSCNVPNPFS